MFAARILELRRPPDGLTPFDPFTEPQPRSTFPLVNAIFRLASLARLKLAPPPPVGGIRVRQEDLVTARNPEYPPSAKG
jgi:hypothetical protein